MPAVPPINPQLLMALAQKFGGIAPVVNPGFGTPGINPNARTPPGYGGGGMAQRGEVLGRPTMPTPGAPRPMPPSLGETLGTVTPKPAGKRGAKTTYDPDGGYVEEDNDGTKRVFDKDNKLIDTIIPPGSPGAGTWQPPAEAKKPGIWDRLTDPSLAGIALAAGQQMTRARYPGESGIGNAVNAVTAGYNTLAQQRQMQVARELAEREWKAKQDKAAIDKLKSEQEIAESKSRQQKIKDEAEDAKGKRNQARQDAAVREMEAIDKANTERRKAATEEQRTTIDQERADALKANYEAQARAASQAQATAWANANTRKKELDEAIRNNKSKAEIDARNAAVNEAEVALKRANAAKEKLPKFTDIQEQARKNVAAKHAAANALNISTAEREAREKTPLMTFDQEMVLETNRLLKEIKDQSAPSTQVGPAAAPQGQPQTAADDKGNVWDLKGGQWVLRPR